MRFKDLCIVAGMALILGCGDTAPGSETGRAQETAPSATVNAPENDRKTTGAETAAAGSITLTVDGQEKVFSHMPAEKNLAMSSATMVLGKAGPGATESFSVLVMNFNIKSAELPVTMSLGLQEAIKNSDSPMEFARAPKPMIEYVSPAGVKYAGYAELTFDSYEGGTAKGSVQDIELYPKDNDDAGAGSISLSDVRFSVAL